MHLTSPILSLIPGHLQAWTLCLWGLWNHESTATQGRSSLIRLGHLVPMFPLLVLISRLDLTSATTKRDLDLDPELLTAEARTKI